MSWSPHQSPPSLGSQVRYIRSLFVFPWARIVTLALGQGRLYAGSPGGRVQIWDLAHLDAGPQTFFVGQGLVRLRMRGRHLVALTQAGSTIEVYDAMSPDQPELVESRATDSLASFTATDSGLQRFWLTRNTVWAATYQPAQ